MTTKPDLHSCSTRCVAVILAIISGETRKYSLASNRSAWARAWPNSSRVAVMRGCAVALALKITTFTYNTFAVR